jgi:RimJ/RimL family protein N-acetyltransferase
MFIRTPRLFLRPSWPEDWQELFALLSDTSIAFNIAGESWPRTVEETKAFVCKPRENLLPHFFIYLRDDNGGRLIGGIGLGRAGKDVELGYWIAPSARGQGYATEALEAMIGHARMLGHPRVIASHFAENAATARVLEKAGFEPTGQIGARFSSSRNTQAATAIYAIELASAG